MKKDNDKRKGAKILLTVAIGVLPEIIFAWIVGAILDMAVWKVWLWIQGIVLVSMGVKSILEYIAYRFIWKNGMVEDISESLTSQVYPNPKKYSFNTLARDYFGSVMRDDTIQVDTRLDAAYTLGTISSQTGFLNAMRIDSAVSEAIDRYHRIRFSGEDYTEDTDQS